MLEAIRNSSQTWWVRGIFVLLIMIFISWGVGSALFSTSPDIAVVNGYSITQEQFLRRLEQEKQQILQQNPALTVAVLEQIGLRQRVFMDLVLQHLLTEEAKKIGLFVSDALLEKTIISLPLFKNSEGTFDRALYRKTLEQNRAGVLSFEEDLRRDLLMQKLVDVVGNSAYISEQSAKERYMFLNEERSIEYVFFPASEYINSIVITEEEVENFYTKNIAMWEQPERISFEYIPFTVESLSTSMNVSKEKIEEYYRGHTEQYEGKTQQEAEKAIQKILAEQIASYSIEDALDKAQSLALEGKSIEDIAKALAIPKKFIKNLSVDEAERSMQAQSGVLGKLRNAPLNTVFVEPIPLRKKGEFALVHVTALLPAGVAPLAEVQDDVEATLIAEKALSVAKEQAEKIRIIAQKKSQEVPFIQTAFFTRLTPPIELPIRSEEFIQNIFSARVGTILPTIFSNTEGAVLVKIRASNPATEKSWQGEKENFIAQNTKARANEMISAFQQFLYDSAKISIVAPEMLRPQSIE